MSKEAPNSTDAAQSNNAKEFERSLDSIASAAERHEMTAFGVNKTAVLEQINAVRQRQVLIFQHQMQLEMNLSMDDPDAEPKDEVRVFDSEGFSKAFQEKFAKKEKKLDEIREKLEGLTRDVKTISERCTAARNPGWDATNGGAASPT